MGNTALFRANGSAQIGTGHVLRSLALAQAWKDEGGESVLLTGPDAPDAESWWVIEQFPVEHLSVVTGSTEDAHITIKTLHRLDAEWLVVDGFDFGEEYQQFVRENSSRMLVIDDHASLTHYDADIIVNHNVFASADMYRGRGNHAEVLSGLGYALLRRQFHNLKLPERPVPEIARRILVTMGGSDPLNVSAKVIEALKLSEVSDLHVTVLLGPANTHRDSIDKVAKGAPFTVVLQQNVIDMVTLLKDIDAAISAGGGTCAELALLRVPMLLLTIAENHAFTVEEYGRRRLAVAGSWFHQYTPQSLALTIDAFVTDRPLRQTLASRAASQVNGNGATRIVQRMWSMNAREKSQPTRNYRKWRNPQF